MKQTKITSKNSLYIFADKSFLQPVLFHNITGKYDYTFAYEDSFGNCGPLIKQWTYTYDSIYDIMYECPNFMYVQAGRVSGWRELINIDIDYIDWKNTRFIDYIIKLSPSAILERKSNGHLQIQFQAVKSISHKANGLHKSWQTALNEIIWKIAKHCGLDWSLEKLNQNSSSTAQNVYHNDFNRIYFNKNNKSIDWLVPINSEESYLEENVNKYKLNYFNTNYINKSVEFALGSHFNYISYNIGLKQTNQTDTQKIKSNSKLIEGTNDFALVKRIREFTWSLMREDKEHKAPNIQTVMDDAKSLWKSFVNSKKSEREVEAVVKNTYNWAVSHFMYIASNSKSKYFNLAKRARKFVRYVNVMYRSDNENLSKSTISRYRNMSEEEVASLLKDAVEYSKSCNQEINKELIQTINQSIQIFYNYSNCISNVKNDENVDRVTSIDYISYNIGLKQHEQTDQTDTQKIKNYHKKLLL